MSAKFTPLAMPADKAVDDLTVIDGIGPGISKALNGAGIAHFAQLAALTGDDVKALEATDKFKGRNDWLGWVDQAKKRVPPATTDSQGPANASTDAPRAENADGRTPTAGAGAIANGAPANDAPRERATEAGAAGSSAAASAEAVSIATIDIPLGQPLPAGTSLDQVTVVITSRSERGRRRAGMDFSRTETPLRLTELAEEVFDAIKADPELIVKARVPFTSAG